jgi:hypothetical protein
MHRMSMPDLVRNPAKPPRLYTLELLNASWVVASAFTFHVISFMHPGT